MGFCNDAVTTIEQLKQLIQRADCCKIIYFGSGKETFAKIQAAAAELDDRCCGWLKDKGLLSQCTPPLNAPAGTVGVVINSNKENKGWFKDGDIQDVADAGFIYTDCKGPIA